MELQRIKKYIMRIVIVGFILFLAIQLFPYGRSHANPPVKQEPKWDSPRTRQIFFRVCKNCHSNETEWPWYSNVAPASWLLQSDVNEARSLFDVSEWGRSVNNGDAAAGFVEAGAMPPWDYRLMHPETRMSADEKAAFIQGLKATFGK